MRAFNLQLTRIREELEKGGAGETLASFPVSLEPPFSPFVPQGGKYVTQRQASHVEQTCRFEAAELSFLRVRPSSEDEFNNSLAEQLIVALSPCQPLAFELVGFNGSCAIQIGASASDEAAVSCQLSAHYPRLEVTPERDLLQEMSERILFSRSYRLARPYPFLLKKSHTTEPYAGLLGVLGSLGNADSAVFQVLFIPVRHDWRTNIMEVSRNPWDPTKSPFVDLPQLPKAAEQKVASPLFAVAVRLAASTRELVDRLESSFLRQFDNGENSFVAQGSEYPAESISSRTTHSHGMILNAAELAALVHLPKPDNVPETLEVAGATAQPPALATSDILVPLGVNQHRGIEAPVGIPGHWLVRHAALFGGTGFGKTTTFKPFFAALAERGYGLAFLDPAGDAAREFLDLIPEHRVQDAMYFNPGDRDYPPALNVLQSSDRDEEMLASELMTGLKRIFSGHAEFGPRMEWITRQALRTLLASEGEKTLRDVPRLLADEKYREEVLKRVRDQDLLWFWRTRAPFTASVIDPILNRLSAFLDRPTIRNIVAQPNLIDFHQVLRESKILVCNLSKGILGEEHSALLGSFILSKLQLATMARAELPPSERKLFAIIVDEFQNYAGNGSDTTSIRSFLSEARKYGVALITATQFTSQLDREVVTAILGNVGTLICLRCGVVDAQILQRELGIFTADDLLNLDTGQALVRMGRADSTFNVHIVPPELPTCSLRDQVVQLSRERYCRPRREVERTLNGEPQRVTPPTSHSASEDSLEADELAFLERCTRHPEETVTTVCAGLNLSGSRSARIRRVLAERNLMVEVDTRLGQMGRRAKYVVPTLEGYRTVGEKPPKGRGGPVHKHFVELVARWAGQRGYEVSKEHSLERGWVDLHLERDGRATAVEVSVTSTVDREIENLRKCLQAGYSKIVMLFLDKSLLQSFRDLISKSLTEEERKKAEVGSLDEFHRLV